VFDRVIDLVHSIDNNITRDSVLEEILETSTFVLSEAHQKEWFDARLSLNIPSVPDYMTEMKERLRDIEEVIILLKSEFDEITPHLNF